MSLVWKSVLRAFYEVIFPPPGSFPELLSLSGERNAAGSWYFVRTPSRVWVSAAVKLLILRLIIIIIKVPQDLAALLTIYVCM